MREPASSDLSFLAAGSVVLVAGAVLVFLFVRQPDAREDLVATERPSVAADADPALPPAPASPDEATPAEPKWTGSRQPTRAIDGSRTVAFELQAERSVPVWGRRVRPVLGVRCLWGETEVFVQTHWAASVEPDVEGHTVHVGFDEEPSVETRWTDSLDYQALFAPDAVTLARRLATARTMRFGFTPHNAAPVEAEFDVRGFEELIGPVARTCGWKP